jgi:hypothetical protein
VCLKRTFPFTFAFKQLGFYTNAFCSSSRVKFLGKFVGTGKARMTNKCLMLQRSSDLVFDFLGNLIQELKYKLQLLGMSHIMAHKVLQLQKPKINKSQTVQC